MPESEPPTPDARPGLAALVIEDEPDVAALLTHHLSALGYACTVRSSAEEAGPLLAGTTYDLVVVDLLLPGRGGDTVVRSIRETPEADRTAVVATSVLGRQEIGEVGADAVLPKPFRAADVVAAVTAARAART